MPLTYDQVTAITRRKFIPKLYDNIFNSNPLFQRIKKKGNYEKLDGGEKIVVPLGYATTTASGWYTGMDTLSVTDNEDMTAAEYLWKQMYASIVISARDELRNRGDSQILNFVKSKTMMAEKTMADSMGTALFNAGTTSNQIAGLRAIINTSSTVGGISQTDYSWWAGQLDSSTTTLTIAAMQTSDNLATVDSESPTVIVTTRARYDSYYNLLQPQQRFVDESSAKGGFMSLMFNGKPVLADSHSTASNMFFINENHIKLYVHKDQDFILSDFIKPSNQNGKIAQVLWMGALGSSNNRLHARMSAITA